jgi:hypothetical protein
MMAEADSTSKQDLKCNKCKKTLMHPDEKRRRLRAEKADEMPEPTPILENIPL